jgi:hypothetical protein
MRVPACADVVPTIAASAIAVAIAAPANELLIDGRIAASLIRSAFLSERHDN